MNQALRSTATVSLKDVAILNPQTPRLSPTEGVAFVPMASVSEEGSMAAETASVADLKPGLSYFQNGDVLVAKITPCYENNKISVASFTQQHGFGSTEFHVLRPNSGALDSSYLVHYLRQDSIRRAGEQRMTGSGGQRRVPRQFLEELPVPLPPLDEQRRIAAILDQADDLRRKRRAALERVESLRDISFLNLFGDPLRNERGWATMNFGDVGSLDRGVSKHRPRNDPALLGGAYPLIQTGDVTNSNGRIQHYMSTYSEAGLRQSKIWPRGTLCITIAANIGRTGILDFDACFPDSVVGFIPGPKCLSEYVQTWLGFLQPQLEADAPQVAQKNINLNILRNLKITIPSLDLQRAFAIRVAEIDKLKASHCAHLATLDALFASLQHRAFRGEL